ncbi:hypothetical protein PR003_g24445 [Phytophthora rubi]|uniref:Uncharacterized protein n=1 Tax=Phytophthora rubi TaxID=129364 RepID=A0A6A4CNL5_9STRA|nr:hypothetical protein PR001_g23162 [Phytophthora rubi]KAE9293678.1 hypothetical protein PR003_g24445 [Phytophthora rubi]
MSVELAVEALMPRRPMGAAVLRAFLDEASKKLGSGKKFWGCDDKASVRFCRSFCELLVDAGDPELTRLFFTEFCPRLGELSDNTTLIPGITKVVQTFDWNDIGAAVLDVLGNRTREYVEESDGESELELTLQVLDGLDDGAALQALLKMAVALTIKADTDPKSRDESIDLNSSKVIGILWKHAIASSDNEAFETLVSHFMQKDPKELGPMIEVFSQYVGDLDEAGEKFTALASIAAKRLKWLKGEIRRLNIPFSWEMPSATFPGIPKIEEFLRGPETSMKTVGLKSFKGLPEARKYAAECVRDNQGCVLHNETRGERQDGVRDDHKDEEVV